MTAEDLKKRITYLETQLISKKTLVEKELYQIELLCKELISLKDKLTSIENPIVNE